MTKALLPEETLRARAHDEGLRVARAQWGPEVTLEALAADADWDGMLSRWTFEQRWAVWKPLSAFDLMVDEQGEVVGFVDHEAYARADDASALSEDEVIALLVEQEVLPARPRIVALSSYPGPHGGRIQVATVEDRGPGVPATVPAGSARASAIAARARGTAVQWTVDINAARRLVVAVWPPAPPPAPAGGAT